MPSIEVIKRDGSKEPLNLEKLHKMTFEACEGLSGVSASQIEMNSGIQVFNSYEYIATYYRLHDHIHEVYNMHNRFFELLRGTTLIDSCLQKLNTHGPHYHKKFIKMISEFIGVIHYKDYKVYQNISKYSRDDFYGDHRTIFFTD